MTKYFIVAPSHWIFLYLNFCLQVITYAEERGLRKLEGARSRLAP